MLVVFSLPVCFCQYFIWCGQEWINLNGVYKMTSGFVGWDFGAGRRSLDRLCSTVLGPPAGRLVCLGSAIIVTYVWVLGEDEPNTGVRAATQSALCGSGSHHMAAGFQGFQVSVPQVQASGERVVPKHVSGSCPAFSGRASEAHWLPLSHQDQPSCRGWEIHFTSRGGRGTWLRKYYCCPCLWKIRSPTNWYCV